MAVPPGFFAVRFRYGSGPTTLDFDVPAATVFPQFIPITGSNLTYSGYREVLFNRIEQSLTLSWENLTTAMTSSIGTWYSTHGALGRQTAITLDRANTCGGQIEYDLWNTVFSKAELVAAPLSFQSQPLAASRFILSKARYAITLVFRQGR